MGEQVIPSAADLLEGAADVLEVGGWVQHAMERNGAHCAIGAINAAASELSAQSQKSPNFWYRIRTLATIALSRTVRQRFGARAVPGARDTVILWNDAVAKDQYQVIDAFRLAAKHYRSVQRYSKQS